MMDKSNTMNSYFRLAIREFGLINSMFTINSPGVGMATADLIRNLLLTCFHGEKKQLFGRKHDESCRAVGYTKPINQSNIKSFTFNEYIPGISLVNKKDLIK